MNNLLKKFGERMLIMMIAASILRCSSEWLTNSPHVRLDGYDMVWLVALTLWLFDWPEIKK